MHAWAGMALGAEAVPAAPETVRGTMLRLGAGTGPAASPESSGAAGNYRGHGRWEVQERTMGAAGDERGRGRGEMQYESLSSEPGRRGGDGRCSEDEPLRKEGPCVCHVPRARAMGMVWDS